MIVVCEGPSAPDWAAQYARTALSRGALKWEEDNSNEGATPTYNVHVFSAQLKNAFMVLS